MLNRWQRYCRWCVIWSLRWRSACWAVLCALLLWFFYGLWSAYPGDVLVIPVYLCLLVSWFMLWGYLLAWQPDWSAADPAWLQSLKWWGGWVLWYLIALGMTMAAFVLLFTLVKLRGVMAGLVAG
jgi:hypothetical protein